MTPAVAPHRAPAGSRRMQELEIELTELAADEAMARRMQHTSAWLAKIAAQQTATVHELHQLIAASGSQEDR